MITYIQDQIDEILPEGYNFEVHTWKHDGIIKTKIRISKLLPKEKEELIEQKAVDGIQSAYESILLFFQELTKK